MPTHLLDAVAEINANWQAHLLNLPMTETGGVCGKTIAVLGIAFKPGTDDIPGSSSVRIVETLHEAGATVRVHVSMALQPAEAVLGDLAAYYHDLREAAMGADAIMIASAWPDYRAANWRQICSAMRTPVILDGRGILNHAEIPKEIRVLRVSSASQ